MRHYHAKGRTAIERDLPKYLLETLLALYILLGLFGAAWIDFDLHDTYLVAIAYITIPSVAFYYTVKFFYPTWSSKNRGWHTILLTLILAFLLPSQVLLINALTGSSKPIKRDSLRHNQVIVTAVKRGGLGILYKQRW